MCPLKDPFGEETLVMTLTSVFNPSFTVMTVDPTVYYLRLIRRLFRVQRCWEELSSLSVFMSLLPETER